MNKEDMDAQTNPDSKPKEWTSKEELIDMIDDAYDKAIDYRDNPPHSFDRIKADQVLIKLQEALLWARELSG